MLYWTRTSDIFFLKPGFWSPVFVYKLFHHGKSVILNPGCTSEFLVKFFFFFLKVQNPWGWDPGISIKKKSPQVIDSNVQSEVRMNVLNTNFFISVSLGRFAPSKTALQSACCKSLWPWQFLLGLCRTIVLPFPSAELLEGYRFCSLCTLADQIEGLFYFTIFHKTNNFPYCSPSEKQDFTIRQKLGYQGTFCATKWLVVYVQMVCVRYFSW